MPVPLNRGYNNTVHFTIELYILIAYWDIIAFHYLCLKYKQTCNKNGFTKWIHYFLVSRFIRILAYPPCIHCSLVSSFVRLYSSNLGVHVLMCQVFIFANMAAMSRTEQYFPRPLEYHPERLSNTQTPRVPPKPLEYHTERLSTTHADPSSTTQTPGVPPRPVEYHPDPSSTTQSAGCVMIELSGTVPGHATRPFCRYRSVTVFAPVLENDSPSRVSTRPPLRSVTTTFSLASLAAAALSSVCV